MGWSLAKDCAMNIRVGMALLAACCLSLPAASASAAPCKPYVKDAAGDARVTDEPALGAAPLNQADLDILGIDFASNAKTLTVTVRLAQVNTKPAPPRVTEVLMYSGEQAYQAYWYVGADDERFVFTNVKGDHDVPGSADVTTGLVRFQVPRSLLPTRLKRFNAAANTIVLVGNNSNAYGFDFDNAGSRRFYTLGTPGCL